MKQITINVGFKNREKGRSLTFVRVIFKKVWLELLDIENNLVKFEYNSKISPYTFTLSKGSENEVNIYLKSESFNRITETKKLAKKNANIENDGLIFSLPSIFFPILKEIYGEISKSFKVDYEIKNNKGVFYLMERVSTAEKLIETNEVIENTEIIKDIEKHKKNIILIKVNKGGIGKTFLASQIASGLAILKKKVLIITSDSQNNILDFLAEEVKEDDLKEGLIKDVLYGKGEIIKLRDNLSFLPLENSRFGRVFVEKLKPWLDKKRQEYDYIIVDSIPTMKIDSEFLEESDYIIIPTYCDSVTIRGVLNLLNEIDLEKVLAIQINKYKGRKVEQKYKKILEEQLLATPILLTKPIPDISFIEHMLERKKSIWEYKNKKAEDIQNIFLQLIFQIIERVEGGIE